MSNPRGLVTKDHLWGRKVNVNEVQYTGYSHVDTTGHTVMRNPVSIEAEELDQLRKDRDELAAALDDEHGNWLDERYGAGQEQQYAEHLARCPVCILLARIKEGR
jgi:hypothetical protein